MEILERGVAAQRAGRIAEAEQCYRTVLGTNPDHAEANYLLGMLLVQRRQPADGEKLLARAIARDPNQPGPHFQRGIALASLKRLSEAVASFDRAIALKPDYVEAYNNRGVTLGLIGRGQEAVASFDRAIALRPDHVDAFVNRGIGLMGLGRAEDAIASFDRALALRPGLVEILFMRGKVRLGQKQAAQALADFDRILAAQSQHAGAQLGRAHALLISDRATEALAPAERATALAPQLAEAWFTRANILLALGRHGEAVADYDRALTLKPDLADAFVNRGNAQFALRRLAVALADYDRAIVLNPDHGEAHLNRANCLVQLNRLVEAVAAFDRAVQLKPGDAGIFGSRGNALLLQGRPEEALASLRQARAIDPDAPLVEGAILRASMQLCDWRDFGADCDKLVARVTEGRIVEAPFMLLFVSNDPALELRCAELYAAREFPPVSPPLWQGEIYRHARIRLAYLSDSFRNHVTTPLIGGLFARHDKARFETVALSLSADDGSAARRKLETAFDRFIDISGESDQAAAEMIRSLEIDILVDLDGFIAGSRPGIGARRPAPVQVNYLGCPNSMGASYVDYILADAVLIGPDDENHYSEKVVRLPDSYQPNSNRVAPGGPSARVELGLPETGFVFCSFNNNHKITPEIFDVWMRLLNQVPGSVLWLLAMNEMAKKNLLREAGARGLTADRLVFAEIVPDQAAHFARQQAADLFLDSWPCNAHTTGSDALWAGLPLITCRGETFAGRVAASLLIAAGLPELVTNSLVEYETLALRLAREPALLQSFRDRLAQNRATSPLFDSDRFIRNLEAAYVRMAEIAGRGESAQSFDVGDVGTA